MNITIIGGGSMGYTYADSFLSAHILQPNELIILDHNEARRAWLKQEVNARIEAEPGAYLQATELLILSVKPQDSARVFEELKPYLPTDLLVLSVMAGVRVATIQSQLDVRKVVRAMPNLPAQVGMGMTAFTAAPEVTRHELIEMQNLLSTTGRAIYFEQEEMIDAATALSGSGPAYLFYFIQQLMAVAQTMGFTESQAEVMVWQTCMGALYLHNKSAISSEEWIRRVASKGGTTEAAFAVFEAKEMGNALQEGVSGRFPAGEGVGKLIKMHKKPPPTTL